IELAKAIRKGPDMPPAQPVADSEPVIVVGDDGGDALSYRRLIQSFEPGTKLYLHAQPAPVVSGWIPVSERMPENDGAYLCWDNRYVTTYAFIFGAWQASQFVAKNITHWMPLPNPPKE
ncbi:MAG: DUF551 domain-containing protein, partial [Klebsiella pneumoniae]